MQSSPSLVSSPPPVVYRRQAAVHRQPGSQDQHQAGRDQLACPGGPRQPCPLPARGEWKGGEGINSRVLGDPGNPARFLPVVSGRGGGAQLVCPDPGDHPSEVRSGGVEGEGKTSTWRRRSLHLGAPLHPLQDVARDIQAAQTAAAGAFVLQKECPVVSKRSRRSFGLRARGVSSGHRGSRRSDKRMWDP